MPVEAALGPLYLGEELRTYIDLGVAIKEAEQKQIDFLVVPISDSCPPDHTLNSSGFSDDYVAVENGEEGSRPGTSHTCSDKSKAISFDFKPYSGSELVLPNSVWGTQIVGCVSKWISLDDGEDSEQHRLFNMFCEEVLKKQLNWCFHVGMHSAIVPPPKKNSCVNYARAVNSALTDVSNIPIWVRIPLSVKNKDNNGVSDGWKLWRDFYTYCDFHPRLGVCLEFNDFYEDCEEETISMKNVKNILYPNNECPNNSSDSDRWIAEPVRAVVVPTSSFLTNRKGQPVLTRRHRTLLEALFKHRVHVIIQHDDNIPDRRNVEFNDDEKKDTDWADSPNENEQNNVPLFDNNSFLEIIPYRYYISKLYQLQPAPTEAEKFCHSYLDYLQTPLQPLQDNLDAATYDTFEKDGLKYQAYEQAIYECLIDKLERHTRETLKPRLAVFGAGRGPLVSASLNALRRNKIVDFEMYCLEKNHNAILTLQDRVKNDPDELWRCVKVIHLDMRTPPSDKNEINNLFPIKMDIIVSELLGSFGDNELSPECLDGAEKHWLKDDGTFIPCEYTSFIEPVSTPKLWLDIRSSKNSKYFDFGYVVQFHSAYYPALEREKKCFRFQHPKGNLKNRGKCLFCNEDQTNRRAQTLSFTSRSDCVIHGFAGYFDCRLYNNVMLSIAPHNATPEMISWFPFFMPLKEKVFVKKFEKINFHIWRLNETHKVWYEWCLSSPIPTVIQNCLGVSSSIGK